MFNTRPILRFLHPYHKHQHNPIKPLFPTKKLKISEQDHNDAKSKTNKMNKTNSKLDWSNETAGPEILPSSSHQ